MPVEEVKALGWQEYNELPSKLRDKLEKDIKFSLSKMATKSETRWVKVDELRVRKKEVSQSQVLISQTSERESVVPIPSFEAISDHKRKNIG